MARRPDRARRAHRGVQGHDAGHHGRPSRGARGPLQLAKTLAAIDILSGGRLVAGVGPGSSAADYAAVGLAFQERWQRFDEALQVLRPLLHGDGAGFEGRFYSTRGVALEPRPAQSPGPPIWVASWGSSVGLRRVARLGDG